MPSFDFGWRRLLSVRNAIIGLLGMALAFFAFANAAAQIGAKLPVFKGLGPAFYSSKADLLRYEMAVAKRPAAARDTRFGTTAIATLAHSPFNARALRNYALYREARGDTAGARKIFRAGDRISRRDGVTQYWLINDAAKRGDVVNALDHFDSVLRTMPEATQPLIERLAMGTAIPEARRALTRFVRADNPWLVRYVDAAVARLPNVEPLAQLFVDAGRAPDLPALRTPYGQIVNGLVSDRKIALLRRFYPLLPDSKTSDLGIKLDEDAFNGGYAPVVWDLGESSDRGGALLKTDGGLGLELYGLPDTRGAAAKKLLIPAATARHFTWSTVDRAANDGSEAYWILECLETTKGEPAKGTKEVRSINLLGANAPKQGRMALPQGCEAILVSFLIDGGTGRDPARMVFNSVAVD